MIPHRGNVADVTTVQSVERAMALMQEAARAPGGLVDLAARADLPTSTAARLLHTLETVEALERDHEGVYRIGRLVGAMTRSVDPGRSLQTIADRHLVELAAELDEAMCLCIPVGYDTVTIRQVDAPKPVRAEDWTGTRVPLHAGCAGIMVMATWPDPDIDDYLAGDLVACSENTITEPDLLRDRIREARSRRAIWSHGEYVDGLSSAAAAVVDGDGRAVAALYTYGPTYRYPPAGRADTVAALVLERADAISAELGFGPTSTPP
jgi:DNA-binding IclR family transcriptional regulator